MSSPTHYRKILLGCLFAAGALLVNGAAMADQDSGTDTWQRMLGFGIANVPKYPGSQDNRTLLVPIGSITNGQVFAGPVEGGAGPVAGVGLNLFKDDHWRVGVAIGANLYSPRNTSESTALSGLGDIPSTALGTVFASYREDWWDARVSMVSDIGGNHEGSRINADLNAKIPLTSQLVFSAGPGLTWASSQYSQTFFGVDAAQSAASGLPAYTPGPGVNLLRFGLGLDFHLTPKWNLVARYTASELKGDDADSPITQKKTQNSLFTGAMYRF